MIDKAACRVTFLGMLALCLASEVRASRRDNQEAVIGACIRQASGGRSWLERTLWALRDQEGGWIGAKVANTNGTHDLGPLQVNSWWVRRISQQTGRTPALVRHWLTNDACFNVGAARWIFLRALASTGDYWRAIGVYHSPTGSRQRRYSISVAAKLRLRFGPNVFSKAAPKTGGEH